MLVVIPARAGSVRVPDKWKRPLCGKSLLQRAIERGQATGWPVVVATESAVIAEAAQTFDAQVMMRYESTATDTAPDFLWAQRLPKTYGVPFFVILRITSPFFGAEHVKAMADLLDPRFSSVRAMTRARQHPAKMWHLDGMGVASPLCPRQHGEGTPWHSSPTQTLPVVYAQTAGCEVVWADTLAKSLAGECVRGYVVDGPAALDINTPEDWAEAERICQTFPTT
jgi:CMP-N-acetylneuraminic acid synthetase